MQKKKWKIRDKNFFTSSTCWQVKKITALSHRVEKTTSWCNQWPLRDIRGLISSTMCCSAQAQSENKWINQSSFLQLKFFFEQYGSFLSSKGTPFCKIEIVWHQINTLSSSVNFNWDLFDYKTLFSYNVVWLFCMWFFTSQKFSYWCQSSKLAHLERKIFKTLVKLFCISCC